MEDILSGLGTDFKEIDNKVSFKIVVIVYCRFKIDDEVGGFEGLELELQYKEAIGVIREWKQFQEYFVIRRNG